MSVRATLVKVGFLAVIPLLIQVIVACSGPGATTAVPVPMSSSQPSIGLDRTLTPTSPLPWRIVFAGAPCSEQATCNEMLFAKNSPQLKVINSDGTNLASLTEVIPALPDSVQTIKISVDGSHLAYSDNHDVVRIGIHDSRVTRLDNALARSSQFDFAGNDCIAVYVYDKNDLRNQVSVEKHCLAQVAPAFWGTVDFPTPQGACFRSYQISPQGDKLLSYVNGYTSGEVQLYVKELNTAIPPYCFFIHLFEPAPETGINQLVPTAGKVMAKLSTCCGAVNAGLRQKTYSIGWTGAGRTW